MTILDELAASTADRVQALREITPLASIRSLAEEIARNELQRNATLQGGALRNEIACEPPASEEPPRVGGFAYPFTRALQTPGLSFICEVKKASPSKGIIAESFPYLEIAHQYEAGGASALSVLTEPHWFLGSDAYLEAIADTVSIPVLRKDFTVDEYQIYQAKVLGASAVLLICSILDDTQLAEYRQLAEELGLSALVETHDETEIQRALQAGANIIGVNNRDLTDFSVSFDNAARLRGLIPADVIYVAESGVKGPEDVERVSAMGADAVLIGEALMRSPDIAATLRAFKEAAARADYPVRTAPSQSQTPSSTTPAVKFCGLNQPEDVAFFNELKPDYAGFVFYPGSSREVTAQQAAALRDELDDDIKTVGVFVDNTPAFIAEVANADVISVTQLHGNESNAFIRELRGMAPNLEIWQAFIVRDRQDIEAANASTADLVLLDAGLGEGRAFDWDLMSLVERPFILAGGLHPENVGEAIAQYHPTAVDVSSGIEAAERAADGRTRKDPAKMRQFMANVHNFRSASCGAGHHRSEDDQTDEA